MSDPESASSNPASTHLVERLFADGHLSRDAYERARNLVWPASRILEWTARGLAAAGALLVAVGVTYWLLYNWSSIPRLVRVGLVEAVVVGGVVGAVWRGLDDPWGELSATLACLAVGGFLLVFGRVYPTGADAWRLFGGWAACTAGLVVVANSQLLWVLWIGLVDAGAVLFWLQTVPESSHVGFAFTTTGIGLYTLFAVAVGEAIRRFAEPGWLDWPWSRWALTALALVFLSIPVWTYVGAGLESASWAPTASFGVWIAVLLAGYLYFRRISFDLVALTMIGVVAASTPTMRLFSEVARSISFEAALLAVGVAVFGGSAILVRWLTGLHEAESEQPPDVAADRREGR